MSDDLHEQLTGAIGEQFRDILAQLEEADAELDRDIEQELAESADERDALAKRARLGELGPEWRSVQNRIDLNETTLEAVFAGEDTTPQAAALRELSSANLTSLAERWEEQDASQSSEPSPVFELRGAAAASHADVLARMEEIAEAISRIGGTREHGGTR